MTPKSLALIALAGIPLVKPGDDLAALIAEALWRMREELRPGDILVVAQKIVSKAEGGIVALATVSPSAEAIVLARETEKDPRLVELILRESKRVVRHRPGVVIVEHRLGVVMANAGIDASNVAPGPEGEQVLLLPENPDASCHGLRTALETRTGVAPGVIVNDSVGRPWRHGTIGMALGAAGLPSLLDLRGEPDLFGRALRVSRVGLADALAAAASLVQGEAAEGTPVILVRGYPPADQDEGASGLIRAAEEDLFR